MVRHFSPPVLSGVLPPQNINDIAKNERPRKRKDTFILHSRVRQRDHVEPRRILDIHIVLWRNVPDGVIVAIQDSLYPTRRRRIALVLWAKDGTKVRIGEYWKILLVARSSKPFWLEKAIPHLCLSQTQAQSPSPTSRPPSPIPSC